MTTATCVRSIKEIEREIHNIEMCMEVMAEDDSHFDVEGIRQYKAQRNSLYDELVVAQIQLLD